MQIFSDSAENYDLYLSARDRQIAEQTKQSELRMVKQQVLEERAAKEAALAENKRERVAKEAALAENKRERAAKEAALAVNKRERAAKEAAFEEIARLQALLDQRKDMP